MTDSEDNLPDTLPGQHSGDERTAIARRYTDSAEAWLRRLVHDELSAQFGPSYITAGNSKGSLKSCVVEKRQKDPDKYPREIDATSFEQLVVLVCNQNNWSKWKDPLKSAYPNGNDEARTFLDRLVEIRNDVSHGRICSGRQVERAVCYTNDLVDSLKEYYRSKGLGREFNVPLFIRVYDNLGNSKHLEPIRHFRDLNFSGADKRILYPGDTLIIEVEVDPSFEPSGYDIVWSVKGTGFSGRHSCAKAIIQIENKHVAEHMIVEFQLMTNLHYHRFSSGIDDMLSIYYKVLPFMT